MRILFCLLTLALMTPSLHAYIDPGAGSILLQLILGGLAGVGVAWKLFWSRFRRKKSVTNSSDGTE